MKRNIKISAFLAALICALARSAAADIYGSDDRLDLFQNSAPVRALAEASVSLWDSGWLSGRIAYNPVARTFKLSTEKLGRREGLCPEENFSKQPAGAFCSGALVGEDLVLTAGHCVKDIGKCKTTKFVFGFSIPQAGAAAPRELSEDDVYGCAELLRQSYDGEPGADEFPARPDYALIRLDRKVTGRKFLQLSDWSGEAPGTAVAYLGYPLGLPLKIAGNASLQSPANGNFITADLDANSGASGAPVLDMNTGRIVGVIAKTHTPDITRDAERDCNVTASYYLPENGSARAVIITRASAFSRFLPQ